MTRLVHGHGFLWSDLVCYGVGIGVLAEALSARHSSVNSQFHAQSWTLAALSLTASGTPCRSITRWRFVPGLPRSVGFGQVSRHSFARAPPRSRVRPATDVSHPPLVVTRTPHPSPGFPHSRHLTADFVRAPKKPAAPTNAHLSPGSQAAQVFLKRP